MDHVTRLAESDCIKNGLTVRFFFRILWPGFRPPPMSCGRVGSTRWAADDRKIFNVKINHLFASMSSCDRNAPASFPYWPFSMRRAYMIFQYPATFVSHAAFLSTRREARPLILHIEPSRGKVAAESSWAPHMRNSVTHPKNDFEGIRSHKQPDQASRLKQKKNVLVKRLHWPAVPQMRKSIGRGFFGAKIATPTVGWLHRLVYMFVLFFGHQFSCTFD